MLGGQRHLSAPRVGDGGSHLAREGLREQLQPIEEQTIDAVEQAARSAAGLRDQPANAALAAATAQSTSSSLPSAISAIGRSVAGLTTVAVADPVGFRHSPSM